MGYAPRGESSESSVNRNEEDADSPVLDEGFYEIEDVIERHLCKTTLSYEYKGTFKGYGPEDDMWLPSSYFNRSINFETKSKFGRKRKHTLEPEETLDEPLKAKRSKKERQDQQNDNKRSAQVSKDVGNILEGARCGSVAKKKKVAWKTQPKEKKPSKRGQDFRASLNTPRSEESQSSLTTSGSDSH